MKISNDCKEDRNFPYMITIGKGLSYLNYTKSNYYL